MAVLFKRWNRRESRFHALFVVSWPYHWPQIRGLSFSTYVFRLARKWPKAMQACELGGSVNFAGTSPTKGGEFWESATDPTSLRRPSFVAVVAAVSVCSNFPSSQSKPQNLGFYPPCERPKIVHQNMFATKLEMKSVHLWCAVVYEVVHLLDKGQIHQQTICLFSS